MNIGDNIRTMREKLGITREELTKRTEISFSQLSKIERNEQKNPTIQSVVAISTALRCSLDELIFNQESTEPNYLYKLINELNEDDKKSIKKITQGLLIVSQTKKIILKEQE